MGVAKILLEENDIKRCDAIIKQLMELLEERLRKPKDSVQPQEAAAPEWDRLFGAKESALTATTKLVALQKALSDLQQRYAAQLTDVAIAPLTSEDWALLALALQRHQERQSSPDSVEGGASDLVGDE
jgi:hypothetical protein